MAKLTQKEQEYKQRLQDAITAMEWSDAPRNWSTWDELHRQLSQLVKIEREGHQLEMFE